ncbi:dihydroneopterin aldolase [Selenomonas sp. F0473]|uniref:dihydroneopterin aldolase n=1 Tax=Selenomonas sp. F0473 TaxID=999423 RepID=UPI00029E102B|nr:dihydroneopterin aldolase [Selenomonas sp. F0473]EKU71447.1 dihydroneopterin aldolase [Selenomonas sp. F0473]
MDRIFLRGMTFSSCHGVLAHERDIPQRFIVDAELLLDLRAAAARDDLAATVNYAEVYEIVRAVAEGTPKRLIEAVAGEIAARTLAAFPRVCAVRIAVHKPEAPMRGLFSDVGVSITRHRGK